MDNLIQFIGLYEFCIGVVLGLIVLWYIYFTWHFDYWKKQGIPGSKPHLFIGTLKPTWICSPENQDIDAMKQYGHLHGGFIGRLPVLYVSDPELVRRILVKEFQAFTDRTPFGNSEKDVIVSRMMSIMKGEKWRVIRNIITPTFTPGRLKEMISLMEECILNVINSIKDRVQNGKPTNFVEIVHALTLSVIGRCAFGISANYVDHPNGSKLIEETEKIIKPNPVLVYIKLIFPSLANWLVNSQNRFSYFAGLANKIIDERSKLTECTRKDFLHLLLEAEIHKDDINKIDSNGTQTIGSKKVLSREVIIAQTILFYLVGHETTSNALIFMVYELAQNQEIQDKLIAEVDKIMAETKETLTYQDIASMKYMDMVVAETLRKHPSAIQLDRICTAEHKYKLNNTILTKGMRVKIPLYAIHYNPEFYPNPHIFDPERFSSEEKLNRNPFTYLPFGEGPRKCIATRFALFEMKLAMAHLLFHYRFQLCPDCKNPLKKTNIIGFRNQQRLQPQSLKLILNKRS